MFKKAVDWISKKIKQADRFIFDAMQDLPPKNRNFYLSYVPLWRRSRDGQLVPVGCFVPELYILAKNNELRVQSLKHGKQLTPFELSIIPTFRRNHIAKFLKAEYKYRCNNGLALPTYVSKYRAEKDYLKHLTKGSANSPSLFVVANDNNTLSAYVKDKYATKDLTFSIDNNPFGEEKQPTRFQRMMHGIGTTGAYIGGAAATVAMIIDLATPITWGLNLMMLPFYAFGIWCVNQSQKLFSHYDASEFFIREYDWMLSKRSLNGKFSRLNTLDAILKMGAIIFMSYGAAVTAFTEVASLGAWALLPTALTSVATMSAAFMFAVAFASTFTASMFVVRYMMGLSCFNNQIKLCETDKFIEKQERHPSFKGIPAKGLKDYKQMVEQRDAHFLKSFYYLKYGMRLKSRLHEARHRIEERKHVTGDLGAGVVDPKRITI